MPVDEREWTPQFAYAVGLIATDGCLVGDGKTVAFVSKDRDLVRTFKACILSEQPIGRNRQHYRVQVVDVNFYDWLLAIGLTPRKSLTLGAVAVPDRLFLDLVRGLLDGDGSIKTYVTVPNRRRYPAHTYQRLGVELHSASYGHLSWVRQKLQVILGLGGWIGTRKRRPPYAALHVLRYSKHESLVLLPALYRDPRAPRLERKWKTWNDFCVKGKPTRMWSRRSGGTVYSGASKSPGRKPMRVRLPPPAPASA